ncbi:MAG TPA: hypothetical protein VG713_02795 [Pirellulales bacterium]|nr:hypothetical protein [Pirellulales bacterium]
MHNDPNEFRAPSLVCTALAWISVGVLGMSFGTTLDAQWRNLTLQVGLVGLASALGLSKAARYRASAVAEREQKKAADVVNKRLGHVLSNVLRGPAMPEAVNRLVAALGDESDNNDRRNTSRRSARQRLITVTPCCSTSDATEYPACLKDINAAGIGFTHTKEMPLGPAVISFGVDDEEISLELDVRWSRMIAPGMYSSGGYFVGMNELSTIERLRNQHEQALLREHAEADHPAAEQPVDV